MHKQATMLQAAQRGIALMMAMIALVAMSLAAMALLRSVDTGNTIAGNVAFKQASSQAADVGLEAAFANLTGTFTVADLGVNHPAGCTTNCTYYATRQAVGSTAAAMAADLPTVIDESSKWGGIDAVSTTGLSIDGAYTIQYVVERMCTVAAVTVDNLPEVCFVTKIPDECAGHDSLSFSPCPIPQGVYFRATFLVTGPRNTKSFSQATFLRYDRY